MVAIECPVCDDNLFALRVASRAFQWMPFDARRSFQRHTRKDTNTPARCGLPHGVYSCDVPRNPTLPRSMLVPWNKNRRLLASCATVLAAIARFPLRRRPLPPHGFVSGLSHGSPNRRLPPGTARHQTSPGMPGFPFPNALPSQLRLSSTGSGCRENPPEDPTLRKIVHLNHAGASPSPQRVLDVVCSHLRREQEDGGYAAQNAAGDSGRLEDVYRSVAELVGAEPGCIALVESATVGWTRAFYAMVQRDELERRASPDGTKRVILVSEAEYAANLVAACQWARDHGDRWVVLALPSSVGPGGGSTGRVDLDALDAMLDGTFAYEAGGEDGKDPVRLDPSSIALVCVTHVPTNSGIVNPVEDIGAKIRAHNEGRRHTGGAGGYLGSIKYLVDACQSVGQMDVDVRAVRCDALVATGRKYLRGPRGTGFLYVSSGMLAHDLVPSHIDHYGCPVASVPPKGVYRPGTQLQNEGVVDFSPRQGAKRFEFWESGVSGRLGLGEAVRNALERGLPAIQRDIEERSSRLRDVLRERIPALRIHHSRSTRCGIVAFWCPGVASSAIREAMWAEGFELSVVPATSTPLDSSETGVPDLVRASVSYTTTETEIRDFCDALEACLRE